MVNILKIINLNNESDAAQQKDYKVIDGIYIIYDDSTNNEINIEQKKFYEKIDADGAFNTAKIIDKDSLINNLWRNIRDYYTILQKDNKIHFVFSSQLNELDNKKILEIGCGSGTPGTMHCLLYKNIIDYYIGIDFALNPLKKLKRKLKEHSADNFILFNIDIFDDRLIENQFDLIFGRGILHHFPSPIVIRDRVLSLLKEGGKAVFLEPLNTNFIIKSLRTLSRPFRPNLVWEFPFSKNDIRNFVTGFQSFDIRYFDGISLLSLMFFFNNKLFNYFHNKLSTIDNWGEKLSFYKSLFLRVIIIVRKS